MTVILFENISRRLELQVETASGELMRGRLLLTRISRENWDFILHGTGLTSGQEHRFALSSIREIIDAESGENVDLAEFRAELETHPTSGRRGAERK